MRGKLGPMNQPQPLADLHRHLDGSLRQATLEELAARFQKRVPRRLKFRAGIGLEEALSKFAFMLSLLQNPEEVRRVAGEICEDAAAEGVTTLELRFAPQLHRNSSIEAVVDAALAGIDGRAGLILCGLFGESPDLIMQLVEAAADRPGVVGIDMAGGPQSVHRWIMEDYGKAFARARDLGLGRTVHAGEGRPPDEIGIAIDVLHAQRIGHGTTLLDEPAIVDLVLEQGVTIEACPTSNLHTGVIPAIESHPLVQWMERGVKVCLNTDNTYLSDTTAPAELEKVRAIPGMTDEHIATLIRCGHEAAFKRG